MGLIVDQWQILSTEKEHDVFCHATKILLHKVQHAQQECKMVMTIKRIEESTVSPYLPPRSIKIIHLSPRQFSCSFVKSQIPKRRKFRTRDLPPTNLGPLRLTVAIIEDAQAKYTSE